jgi:hypothetical protein
MLSCHGFLHLDKIPATSSNNLTNSSKSTVRFFSRTVYPCNQRRRLPSDDLVAE